MSGAVSRIAAVCSHFAALQCKLACPICRQPLNLQANSFKCANGHCYDLSAQNYLNLAPQKNQTLNKYNTVLFNARRQVFAGDFYEPLLQKLLQLCTAQLEPDRRINILDAGCGEGYFANQLHQRLASVSNVEVLALDLAKSAVQLAAKTYRQTGLYCLIGDLTNLPLPDNSMDIIVNLLSPANYQEFCRVLKPGGLLIKVIPGANYLAEVRNCLHIPAQTTEAQQQVTNLWQQTFAEAQEDTLNYRLPVTPDLAAAFLQMSPLSFNHSSDIEQIEMARLFKEITIDLKILTYRNAD